MDELFDPDPAVDATAGNRAESLVAAGTVALDVDGDLGAGARWFELAYRVAESSGDPHAMAAAALGLGGWRAQQHRTVRAGAVLEVRLRQALSLIEPGSPLGIRLRARLAAEADRRDGGPAATLAVLADARACTDPVARVEALNLALQSALGPGHGPLRQGLAGELTRASVLSGRRGDLLMSVLWQAVVQLLDGGAHARRLLGEVRDMLADGEHLAAGFLVSTIDVMLAIRGGRLGDAEESAGASAARGAAAGDTDAYGWYWYQLVAIRWYQGRLGELRSTLEDTVHSPDFFFVAALALAAARAGDRRTAEGALARLGGGGDPADLTAWPRSGAWLATMALAVEAADLLDRADLAARAYDLLLPFARLPTTVVLGGACFGSVHHALGVAALTCGRPDRAVEHLRAAVQADLALGHWPAVARSRQRYAQALARRGGPEDLALARQALTIAHREAAAMGVALPGADAAGRPEPAAATGSGTGPLNAACVRDGRRWRIELDGRRVLVGHAVGMLYLAVLLASPAVDVPAVDLAAGAAALNGRSVRSGLSTQPVLDRAAIQEYRQRLAHLRAEIDELESAGRTARAAAAHTERDWLIAELAAAAGLGGRTRRFTDDAERARLSVGRAIRRAIARVRDADPAIGEHLQSRIHTGNRCSYQPGGPAAPAASRPMRA
jgi:tetratricopeptide (TPR) repeat protein